MFDLNNFSDERFAVVEEDRIKFGGYRCCSENQKGYSNRFWETYKEANRPQVLHRHSTPFIS